MGSPSNEDLLEKAEYLFSLNRLAETLELLKKLPENQADNSIVLLQSRFNGVQQKRNRGIVDNATLEREMNQIRLAILEFIQSQRRFDGESTTVRDKFQLIEELVSLIDTTFNTWQAQTKLKERLLEALGSRFELGEYQMPYDLFSDYYDQMNDREVRLHKTIRGYTQNVIYPANIKVIQLIKDNPQLKDAHKDVRYLEQHLALWRSKYDSLFLTDESVCLIFVGLEEGMKFPPNLLGELKEMLEKHRDQ